MKGCEGVLGWHGVCLIEMQGAALQQPAGARGGSGRGGLPGGGNGKVKREKLGNWSLKEHPWGAALPDVA